MVDFGLERDLGRLEGVLGGELDVDAEGALGVRRALRHQEAVPRQDVGLVHHDVAEGLEARVADVL